MSTIALEIPIFERLAAFSSYFREKESLKANNPKNNQKSEGPLVGYTYSNDITA